MICKLTSTGQLCYWCEGCKHAHCIPAKQWDFTGNLEAPTLSPSVRHFWTHPETKKQHTTCHYHLKNGVLEYCGDCEHEFKGTSRKLVDIPDGYHIPD